MDAGPLMEGLPDGFVLDPAPAPPPSASDLPDGFTLDPPPPQGFVLDPPDTQPQPADNGEFLNAFYQSAGPGTMTLGGHTIMAIEEATGDNSLASSGEDLIRRGEEAAKGVKAPSVQSLSQIGSLGDAWKFVEQGAGQALGSSLVPMIGGIGGGALGSRLGKLGATVGAVGGAFAGSNALNIGSMRQTLLEEGVTDPKIRGKAAVAGGMAISALDSFVPGGLASKLTGGARKEVEKAILRRILSGAKTSAIEEGLTEGTQQAIQDIVGKDAAGKPIDWKKLLLDVADNAAAGFIGGGLMGGGTEAIAGPGQPQAQPQPQPKPTAVGDFLAKAAATPESEAVQRARRTPGYNPPLGLPAPAPQTVARETKADPAAPLPPDDKSLAYAQMALDTLRAAGHSEDDIASMSDEQAQAALKTAVEQGVVVTERPLRPLNKNAPPLPGSPPPGTAIKNAPEQPNAGAFSEMGSISMKDQSRVKAEPRLLPSPPEPVPQAPGPPSVIAMKGPTSGDMSSNVSAAPDLSEFGDPVPVMAPTAPQLSQPQAATPPPATEGQKGQKGAETQFSPPTPNVTPPAADVTPQSANPQIPPKLGISPAPNVTTPEQDVTKPAKWVVRQKSTGRIMTETSDPQKVGAVNTAKYEAVPSDEYLNGLKQVGVNPDGNVLYEDKRGVRSFVDKEGALTQEPFREIPGDRVMISRSDQFEPGPPRTAPPAPQSPVQPVPQEAAPQIGQEEKAAGEAPQGRAKPEDLSMKDGTAAYSGMSFTPEKRAEGDIKTYVNDVNGFHDELLARAETDEQKAVAQAQVERYRTAYVEKQRGLWTAKSRTISPMITGPARFPTARNEKHMGAERRRIEEFLDWRTRARAAAHKAVNDARSPEKMADDDWLDLKERLDRSIRFNASTSATNIKGRIERLAANGQGDLVRKALAYLREQQASKKRTLFTERNSIWALEAKVAEKAAQPQGDEVVGEYAGARVVDEKADQRVRIYFEAIPKTEIRDALRGAGWKWSPSNKAWQRQNTVNARHSAQTIIGKFFSPKEPEKAAEPEPEPEPAEQPAVTAKKPRKSGSSPSPKMPALASKQPVFYSALHRAVQSAKQEKASPAQWIGTIKNMGGVKPAEMEWLGLEDWLRSQPSPVTRQKIIDFVRANQVNVDEVVKGAPLHAAGTRFSVRESDGNFSVINEHGDVITTYGSRTMADETAQSYNEQGLPAHLRDNRNTGGNGTKFSQYTLPGGENYRELLLTLPEAPAIRETKARLNHVTKRLHAIQDRFNELFGRYNPQDNKEREQLTTEQRVLQDELRGLIDRDNNAESPFQSSHFSEPNILAHVRFNERTDAEGKRVLFIEEIQSDWHQKGRKGGYAGQRWALLDSAKEHRVIDYVNGTKEQADAEAQRRSEEMEAFGWGPNAITAVQSTETVPNAPFKTTWPELAFKRMVRWAAENGFDKIAWAPGDVQAERYDLSKQVSRVSYAPRTKHLRAWKGEDIVIRKDVEPEQLPDVIGKEAAEKLLKTPLRKERAIRGGVTEDVHALSGLDLKVGGEGMKGFYDKILVDVANKLGKKFGAKVGRIEIVTDSVETADAYEGDISDFDDLEPTLTVPAIPITDAMRDSVMEGQSLFRVKDKVPPSPKGDGAQERREARQERRNTKRELQALANQTLGHDIIATDLIHDPHTGEPMPHIDGLTHMGAVWIALKQGGKDPRWTLRHEAVHVLRSWGVFTKGEWNIASRSAIGNPTMSPERRRSYIEYYHNQGLKPDQVQELLIEEMVADHLADLGSAPLPPMARRIIDKIRRFLEAAYNLIRGDGFQSIEDIARKLYGGEMKTRPRGSGEERFADMAQPSFSMPPSQSNAPASFNEPEDSAAAYWTNRNLPLLSRVSGAAENKLLPLRRAAQDRMVDWKRIEKAITGQHGPLPESMKPYRSETLYYGRTGERLEELRENEAEPLIDEMSKRKVSLEDFDRYLTARHAPERNAYIRSIDPGNDAGSGMSDAEAAKVMADFTAANRIAALDAIAAKADKIIADSRKVLRDGGVIDQATYDKWSSFYRHYVPLRGHEVPEEEGAMLPTGRRFDTRAKVDHRALGRKTMSDSPTAYVLAMAQQAIVLSEKARVGRSVLQLARKFPNKNVWEIDQAPQKRALTFDKNGAPSVKTQDDNSSRQLADNVLAVRNGGNLYHVTIHHKGMLQGIKMADGDVMNGLVRSLATVQRYLAMMVTSWNPEFMLPNFFRDIQTATIHIGAEQGRSILKNTLRDVPKAIRGAYQAERGNLSSQWAQHAREWALAGGKTGAFGLETIEDIKARVDREIKWSQGKMRGLMKARDAGKAVMDWVGAANSGIEGGVRLALYKNLRSAGVAQDEAAAISKEVTTNFNRKGSYGTFINGLYLFFNANVQGTMRVASLIAKNRKVQGVVAGAMVAGFLLDMMNAFLSGDSDDDGEDDYDQVPDYVRERNLVLMIPGSAKGGKITIPLPWVYNLFPYIGTNVGRVVRGKIGPADAVANIASAALNSANPFQAYSVVESLLPTLTRPFIEVDRNKDWKGDRIMPDKTDQSGIEHPNSHLAFKTVTPESKWIAETLNRISGGDEAHAGRIDVSPESIDYIVKFAFGGVGALMLNTRSVLDSVMNGEPPPLDKIPFARKLYSEHSAYTGQDEYYQMRNNIRATVDAAADARKQGNKAVADRLRQDYPADFKVDGMLKDVDKELSGLRKQRDRAATPEERDRVVQRMDKLMARFRKRYRSLMEQDAQ